MRATLVLLLMVLGARSTSAAPPTLTATGELEPGKACVTYMDFTHAVRGSAPDGLADSITTMTYDAKGRVSSERWWRIDTPVRVLAHSYDVLGRRDKTTWKLTDGKLVLTIRYRYDASGNLLSKTTRYPNGQKWKNSQRFDKRGRLILSRESGESGTMMSRHFSYKDGRIVEERLDRTGNGKIDERTRYHYDAVGRLHSKRMKPTSPDYADQLIELTRDERGRLTEWRNSHIWANHPKWNGPREVRTYKYDAADNLISVERRVTPTTGVGVRWSYDYSCHDDGAKQRSVPAAKCRSSYPNCGTP